MWALSRHSKQLALAHAQLESMVLRCTAELQILSQRLLKVRDEERRRLSRDLHDITGQTLAALRIRISVLQEHCKQDPSAMVLASEVAVLTDQAYEEIRTMSYLLDPPLLNEVGFACAAEWYVEGFAKRAGVNVKLDVAPPQERLPIEIEVALFRALKESLTNVHQHSGVSEVSVCLQHQLEELVLEIRDDGCGIPLEGPGLLLPSEETGVSLAGMRERISELNGKLEIESNGHGTTMRVIVPRSATTQPGRPGARAQVTASSIPRGTPQLPGCCICNSPVLLETCKTDEYGQAVHEECYVRKVCSMAEFPGDETSASATANPHAIYESCGDTMAELWESPRPMRPDLLATMFQQRANHVFWHKGQWKVDLAGVVAVLLLTLWIAYSDRHPDSFSGSAELQRTTAIEEQVPRPPAKAVAEQRSKLETVPVRLGDGRTATLRRRLGLAEIEVVHIGEDVTVRYFTPKPVPHKSSAGQYQIVQMGEDVTVRYFSPFSGNTRN